MATNAKTSQDVYLSGSKQADGNGGRKPLAGGKGAKLAAMAGLCGLPVGRLPGIQDFLRQSLQV